MASNALYYLIVIDFWVTITPFFIFLPPLLESISEMAEQHREIGAVLLYT
jgi:hypothetical protein